VAARTLGMAKDSVVDGTGTKKVAIGAGLALALQVGLRFALGGPLALVLTAAAGASMLAYLVRNQKDVLQKVQRYRGVIAETEKKYASTVSGWRDGNYDLASATS
jgi:tetrahydromethanopterin S-methyltransferase subunit D